MTEPQPTETARQAVERNAKALASGEFATVMADVTPQALAQLMQMGSQAGQMSPGQMPPDAVYFIEERGATAAGQRFDVTFSSSIGTVSLNTTWTAIAGRWKVAAVEVLEVDIHDGAGGEAPH